MNVYNANEWNECVKFKQGFENPLEIKPWNKEF